MTFLLAKCKAKKGYSRITDNIETLLVDEFNNHPHVIVLPITKDTLLVKNDAGEKVAVRKILNQVSLGQIFSNIVNKNPAIKGIVRERAFHYIIGGLGCVR